ncbi:MAG: pyruvate kinase [Desulfosalsimonas sp.]
MPKTKIVCTIGPACADKDTLVKMIKCGMSVARLNFSHGSRQNHADMIGMIRSASREAGSPVAILQDLRGPKIRVGEIEPPGIQLKTGDLLILTTESVTGRGNRVPVSYTHLPVDVSAGDTILLADGLMELVVTRIKDTEIHCEVITGGTLTSYKGINLPSGTVRTPAITEKDRADLEFGLSSDVDYIAMSFVRSAGDVLRAKEIISEAGRDTPVIAKIEKHEALNDIDGIVDAADGIMVARGDLGVEIPLENVPGTQKMLVHKGNEAGKPVIIATQMLRSMLDSPRPTRAEAADVANAVLDGADALMLSEETAIGSHPVRAAEYMARIAGVTEEKYPYEKSFQEILQTRISESVAHATCILSDHLSARAIIATTKSGYTAHQIARFRPKSRIIAVSPEIKTVRRLALYWGCIPGLMDYTRDTDEMFERATGFAIEKGYARENDLVVITAGHPMWESGTTNMITVRRMGDEGL